MISFKCFYILSFFIILSFSDNNNLINHDNINRIAIIGAGAGGSSSSYFIRQFAGDEIDIDVFEAQNIPGGRVKSLDMVGEHTELGGSIYHKENKLFSDFVKMGKFETYDPINGNTDPKIKEPKGFIKENHELGVWNGKEILFQENANNKLFNIINGLWRYGFDSKYISNESHRVLHKFLPIYDLIEKQSYSSVESLLDDLQLLNLTRLSLKDHFISNNFCQYNNGAYCNEIVTGLTRVNYGQSMDLNALVGLIALIGSTDDILGVVGGNYKVMEYALWRSNALVRYNSNVTQITKYSQNDKTKYSITYYDSDNIEHIIDNYDKIVIACPLEFANITMKDIELPSNGMEKRPYQATYVSMVVGDLNLHDYFGYPESVTQPQMIITTEDPQAEFSSIFLHSEYNKEGKIRKLYKVFSRSFLPLKKLDDLFANITFTYQTVFNAYPVLHPIPESISFPPFILDDNNIYYINAMESAFSTIETEMISGKNIAKLLVESLEK